MSCGLNVFLVVFVLQLTDVDPDYGKAPTAQLADKLPESGRAGEVFDTTREMLLETQVWPPFTPCRCCLAAFTCSTHSAAQQL